MLPSKGKEILLLFINNNRPKNLGVGNTFFNMLPCYHVTYLYAASG